MRRHLAFVALLGAAVLQAVVAEVPAAAFAAPAQRAQPVQRLNELVAQAKGAADSNQTASMVRLAREVVKGVVSRAQSQQPAPRVAAHMLDTLARAAEAAATAPVHRGQLLVERSKLLNAMGQPEAATQATEGAAAVFRAELAAWAAHPSAGTPLVGPACAARQAAAAALGSLLDVAALWRQLGREERANTVLADAVRVAPLVPSTPNYLRALAQLSELTDEQLEGVLGCMAAVERRGGPAAATCAWLKLRSSATGSTASATSHSSSNSTAPVASGATLGSNGTAPNSSNGTAEPVRRRQAGPQDGGQPVADLHRLYYAAHRGLHARKRYSESWRALERAKAIHFGQQAYSRDFERMVDDMVQLFPTAERIRAAVAQEGSGGGGDDAGTAAGTAARLRGVIAGGAARLQRLMRGAAGRPRADGDAGQAPPAPASSGAAAAAAGPAADADTVTPIFVLGLPRSGSTLAEQILASHPEVYGAGEHSSLRTVTNRLQGLLANNGSVGAAQLAQLRRRYLHAMRSRVPVGQRGARWLVDKALSNAWLVGHIAVMMPGACVVHAVRHPADAALSSFQQSFFPDKVPWSFNLTTIAAHVKAHHRLMAHWDAVLPGRVLHLHYSHMVQDQEGTTRRLVQHCGLPWDPAFLRFYETERAVQTASQLQVKKPIYSSSLSKWPVYREGLAPLLLELRETILGYEQAAGLSSSAAVLDGLAAQRQQEEEQQQQGEAADQQPIVEQGGGGRPEASAAAAIEAVEAAAREPRQEL